jgi:hypothetical protein
MGHRQKYTTIKVTGIEAPTTKKKAAKPAKADKPAKAAKADKASKPSDDAGTEEA